MVTLNRSFTNRSRAALGASLLVASLFGAQAARAEGTATLPAQKPSDPPSAAAIAEARTRFNRGLALYKDGDLPSALAELRRADALAPSYRLKYNIGQVCEEQHDYACALGAFQAYLDGGGSEIPRTRRSSVEAEMQKLLPFVAELRISVDEAGAEISIDDSVIGTAPLAAPVKVSSGGRRVSARHGASAATRRVEIAGGELIDVSLTLRADTTAATQLAPRSAASPPPAPPARATNAKKRTIVWVGWTGAGACALGSAITGVLALSASHDLAHERGAYPASSDQLAHTRNRASQLALAADVLGVLALASAGTALYFTFTPETQSERAEGGSIALHGQF